MEKVDKTGNRKVIGSVLVVGGGIAGIQAALDLANSGYYVYMTEKKSAIGGIMAQLDKTFPTNDCSMCVISPKLVECGRHLNINLMTLTEIEEVTGSIGNFKIKLKHNPRYIDLDKCTSCGECASVCPIETPNLFDESLRKKKAAFKLYPQGMPSAYSIEKKGTAPCKATCPAHVSIQGYIALTNDSRYKEALSLFKDEHPFPGICGRVCHHPCETECTRKNLDEPLAIREVHRFLADYEYQNGEINIPDINEFRNEKIAIIGSGPAGLTAAQNLLRKGYKVTVFEKMPQPGGMMRYGIPEYRLPRHVIDHEIKAIIEMGADIKCDITFGKDITLESLKNDGYNACFIAIGLHNGRNLDVDNEDISGVIQGVDFLRDVAMGHKVNIGKKVIVIGGGNVAIDVALTAKRKGAKDVTLICLEKREEMPAWEHEITEAIESQIKILNGFGPKTLHIGDSNCITGLQFRMCTDVFDSEGRFNPQYDDSVCEIHSADTIIIAIGQTANLDGISEQGINLSSSGGVKVNPLTLQTSLDWVFAGGDIVYGPKSIVDAVACGKEAAESIDRFINGESLENDREKKWELIKPNVDLESVIKSRVPIRGLSPKERECNFCEVSHGYDENEVKIEASRCLKCGVCSECYQCVTACLAEAIDHNMLAYNETINVGAIVIAPGFTPFNPTKHKTYNYANHPNIVTSLEFERILSASGPYAGHMVRPSDDKEPSKIAWLQCVGSRDINLSDYSYCSSVCCMYTNKQTVIAKEHSTNPLDTAVFFMDMRTCGKDFEKYYMRAKNEKGVRYIRSKVHTINPVENDNLMLRYVTEEGEIIEEIFDMVVLAVGLTPTEDHNSISEIMGIDLNKNFHASTKTLTPVNTTKEGIFVCGSFQEPKDIPQSVMEASAAAASATELLTSARNSMVKFKELPPELDISMQEPRVGVFVCNCGINIGGVADVPAVREYASNLPYVVHVEDNLFTCSQDTQDKMKEVIKEKRINRVVVASCSPRTHEPLFQETIRDAGLNKYLFEMANIRDQNTWVHINDPEKATYKAKDLVRMAIAKSVYIEPLHQVELNVIQKLLVIGGGVAGMEAALGVANHGMKVYLIEKTDKLGGIAHKLRSTWQGELIKPYLDNLIELVQNHPNIELYMNAEVVDTTGIIGNFTTTLMVLSSSAVNIKIQHGATVFTTGGKEYIPSNEYLYGEHPNVLTHLEFDELISHDDSAINENKGSVVFIQCVGSRNDVRPYCSKLCCTHTIKSALTIKDKNPNLDIYVLYRDIRSYGFREELYKEAREKGIIFIRYDSEKNIPVVKTNNDGNLKIVIKDHILQSLVEINPNFLVLATAILPSENQNLFELFKVPVNSEGFLIEAHAKLRPVDFSSEGMFMAGLAHYPKALDETIAQAKASVARVMTVLSKENIMVGGVVAEVNPDKCAVCVTCVRTCPYNIPFISDNGHAVIEPAECHGCGSCAAECPGKAIELKHFTDEQMIAKTKALFNIEK